MAGLKEFLKDDRALEGSEYAVALSLIVAAVLVALATFLGSIIGVFLRVIDVLRP